MPLHPLVRRERRAEIAKRRDEKVYPRAKCHNCGKLMVKTRANKRFCKIECKREFERYGSAFGPLKDYLTKLIEKSSKEQAARQFLAYVNSKAFRRHMGEAGFVHRSMIKPKPAALTSASLLAQITTTGRLLKELGTRLFQLEERHRAGVHPATPSPHPEAPTSPPGRSVSTEASQPQVQDTAP